MLKTKLLEECGRPEKLPQTPRRLLLTCRMQSRVPWYSAPPLWFISLVRTTSTGLEAKAPARPQTKLDLGRDDNAAPEIHSFSADLTPFNKQPISMAADLTEPLHSSTQACNGYTTSMESFSRLKTSHKHQLIRKLYSRTIWP